MTLLFVERDITPPQPLRFHALSVDIELPGDLEYGENLISSARHCRRLVVEEGRSDVRVSNQCDVLRVAPTFDRALTAGTTSIAVVYGRAARQ